jgi:iron complex transport system ATP-binding protein
VYSRSVPALEVRDVTVRYASRAGEASPAALFGASFVAEPGEIVMVLGPNGAGKSTLLRVLAGTLDPTVGEVRIGGRLAREMTRREIARQVAFVAQSEEVRFAFTVRDVVMMGRAPHQDGWMRPVPSDIEAVDRALAQCDLTSLAGRSVDQLSGGEQKRVALARAFAQDPRVMLLDEPTAFLDVRHQVGLLELLCVAAAREMTAVVVTHDLALAAAYATRVLLVKGGKLLADGSVDDVLTEPRLGEAFDWPIEVAALPGSGSRVFVPRPGGASNAGN